MGSEPRIKIHDSLNIIHISPELWRRLERMDRELMPKTRLDLLERLISIAESRLGVAKANETCPYCGANQDQDQKQTATVPPSSP